MQFKLTRKTLSDLLSNAFCKKELKTLFLILFLSPPVTFITYHCAANGIAFANGSEQTGSWRKKADWIGFCLPHVQFEVKHLAFLEPHGMVEL